MRQERVAEDAESRVERLSVSVLRRLALTAPPWRRRRCTEASITPAPATASRRAAARSRASRMSTRRIGQRRGTSAHQRCDRHDDLAERVFRSFDRRSRTSAATSTEARRPSRVQRLGRSRRPTHQREFETVDAYWEPHASRERCGVTPPIVSRRSRQREATPTRSSPNPSPPPTNRAMRRPNVSLFVRHLRRRRGHALVVVQRPRVTTTYKHFFSCIF